MINIAEAKAKLMNMSFYILCVYIIMLFIVYISVINFQSNVSGKVHS